MSHYAIKLERDKRLYFWLYCMLTYRSEPRDFPLVFDMDFL